MIKIELPDDVALAIMTAIAGQVGKTLKTEDRTESAPVPESKPAPKKSYEVKPRVLQALEVMPVGTKFTTQKMVDLTEQDHGKVSSCLSNLTLKGNIIKRVSPGYYQKV